MGDMDWLPKTPLHECGPLCDHAAGITLEKKVAPESPVEPSMGKSGMFPRGGDPNPRCADCDEPLSEHTSPVLRDGVVVGLACPTNSCRRFVPR